MAELKQSDVDWLREFWTFVAERQAIYWRRKSGKLPPWTEDPVLREYFFTNVYRELDAGTQYYLDKVAPIDNARELVLATLAYRYFNNEPTWDFILEHFGRDRIPWGKWDWKEMAIALTNWERKGNQVFTGAFTVTGVRFGGQADKISNICFLVNYFQEQAPRVAKEVAAAHNLKQIFQSTFNLMGLGAFLAYEVTIDLNYTWLVSEDVTEDDFVNPGPGCKNGLNYMWPNRRDYVNMITQLRQQQEEYFNLYGLDFKRYDDKELTLRNIEHSLCEFSKYARTKYGRDCRWKKTIAKTRRYVPKVQPALQLK
jgi:hypothetical protein